MKTRYLFTSALLIVVLAFALTACGGGGEDDQAGGDVAPAPVETATASPTATAVALLPETSGADEGALDTALVAQAITVDPGEAFETTWHVRNTGDREWSDASGAYVWMFVGGDQMNGPSQLPIVGTVAPGAEYEITMELTAPQEPGTYEGRWQLHDPDGQPLGSEIGVRVEVSMTSVEPLAAEPAVEAPATDAVRSDFVAEAPAAETVAAESAAEAFVVEAPAAAVPTADVPAADVPSDVPQEGCLDAAPVADVTIPDGTVLDPGETFTKIWRVRNSGSCDWDDALGDLQWVFVSGAQMDGPSQVPIVGPVPAGGEYDVELELTAPQEPGTHEGRWQVQAPNGDPVGVVFWVLIEVPGPDSAAAPGDTPPSGGGDASPPADASGMAQQIWQLINGERDRHQLYQLAYNEKLALAAQRHAEDCSQRGSCSHTGSDGSDEAVRVLRVGYQGSVDESWAMAMAPANAVHWWLDEVPPNDWHRRMVLSDWATEVGVGVAPAAAGYYFIAVFGVTGR